MSLVDRSQIGEQDLARWDGTDDLTFTRDTSQGYTLNLNVVGHYVDAVMAYGGGVTFTDATLTAAMAAIGAVNKVQLVLRPGTWTISNDITLTSNLTIVPAPGCKFTVANGKTATIQGPVVAGAFQWIYGTGTTTISSYPQDQAWWGNAERLDVTGLTVGGVAVTGGTVSDTAYGAGWDGVTTIAPSKNAVYDKVETLVSDTEYGSGWNGDTDTAPSKNAVYDKLETMVSNDVYGSGWNGDTDTAPSRDAVYDKIEAILPVGMVLPWPMGTPPTGYLECDGSLITMNTYTPLALLLNGTYGKSTGTTFTADSSTDFLTSAGHGLTDGTLIMLSNSGGALPSGLSATTPYYVVNKTTNTFQVSLTLGGAYVNFASNGTGTHKFHTQICLPDYRGRFLRGWAHGQTTDPDKASRTDRGDGTTGDYVGTKQADEFKSHTHTFSPYDIALGVSDEGTNYHFQGLSVVSYLTESTHVSLASSGGNESRPININVMWIIKY